MQSNELPAAWHHWTKTGKHGKRGNRKKNAALRCLHLGIVRGYLSDLPLDPSLPWQHSLYPSIEHLSGPSDQTDLVVETRIVNDMKSHLTEAEFWSVIEHLYAVGLTKGRIKAQPPQRLGDCWKPARSF
jgi:hypothetical protein